MAGQGSSPSLELTLSPSRWQLLVLLVGHLVPVLLLSASEMRLPWQMVAVLLILLHGIHAYRKLAPIRELRRLAYQDSGYVLVQADGRSAPTDIRVRFLTPWLTILEVQLRGRWHFLPLFTDSSDAESLRRLRVLLRCGRV